MKRRFLLDVVVGKGATILELLAGEDETLLVRGDACGVGGMCDVVRAGIPSRGHRRAIFTPRELKCSH